MYNILYLLLRRMRVPFIVVILAYAISILGLVLMPGMDDQGNPWNMSIFHAFYFVSFMGSTIGFGEIPYPFSDAQRIWTTLAMYMTVISWLYAIGALFSIVQDKAFRRVVAYANFAHEVRRIREQFYLVCGFGDAGQLLIRELAEHGIRSVVIDRTKPGYIPCNWKICACVFPVSRQTLPTPLHWRPPACTSRNVPASSH